MPKLRFRLSALLLPATCFVLLWASIASAQAPVDAPDEVIAFIHIDQPGRQALRLSEILSSFDSSIQADDLKAIFTRKLGDPSEVLMPVDGSLTAVWIAGADGAVFNACLLSDYPLTPYMHRCLESVGLAAEKFEQDVVFIYPDKHFQFIRPLRQPLLKFHQAVHPANFSLTLRRPMLESLSTQIEPFLRSMDRYRFKSLIQALQPEHPPLAVQPLGLEADRLLNRRNVSRDLSGVEQQWVRGLQYTIDQVETLHFDVDPFTDVWQPRLTLHLKPGTDLHAFSQSPVGPSPAQVRYLPVHTGMRFASALAPAHYGPFLAKILRSACASQDIQKNPYLQRVLKSLEGLDGAQGPLVAAFTIGRDRELKNLVAAAKDFSSEALENIGLLAIHPEIQEINFKADARKLERHPVDLFLTGEDNTETLLVARPGKHILFADSWRGLFDTNDRVLRVKPLNPPLLSQQAMIDGLAVYADLRPANQTDKEWQNSAFALLGLRIQEGVIQLVAYGPVSSLFPLAASVPSF